MSRRLERMRANPQPDWGIADIEAVCREFVIACTPPSGGSSHYEVSHPGKREIVTVPIKRPIKPVYIRKLVQFIDAVRTS